VPFFQPRKHIRLAHDAYADVGNVYSVTIATRERQPVLADPALADACIAHLRALRTQKGNPVYAYCLMPDHAHVLLGVAANSPVGRFIAAWKSLCYRERRHMGNPDPFWQRGYFDHALRNDEDLRMAALYILNNPVRRGLASDFHEFEPCGSLEFEL
jgi:putative transposase